MAARTPHIQNRNQFHRDWGNYASLLDMPNAAGMPLPDPNYSLLEPGDTAFSQATGQLCICINAGSISGGDAVWIAVGGGAVSVRDSHRVVVGLTSAGDVAGVSCDYADAGDGVALAAAFAALSAGQDIALRTGTYYTETTLTVPNGSRLVGMGPENTIIQGGAVALASVLVLDKEASAVDIAVQALGPYDQIISMSLGSYIFNVATQSDTGAPATAHVRANVADRIRIQNFKATLLASNNADINAIVLGNAGSTDYGGSDILIQNVAASGFSYAIAATNVSNFTFENVDHKSADLGGVNVRWRNPLGDIDAPYLIRNVRCVLRDTQLPFFFYSAVMLEADEQVGRGVIDSVWMLVLSECDPLAIIAGVQLRCNAGLWRGTKIHNVDLQSVIGGGVLRGVWMRSFTAGLLRDSVIIGSTVFKSRTAVYMETILGGQVDRSKVSHCAGEVTLADAGVANTIVVMNSGGLVDAGTATVQSNNIP